MKFIRVFLLCLFNWHPGAVAMEEPVSSLKNIFTIPDAKIAGVAFFAPHLFAMATINRDFSSTISIADVKAKEIIKSKNNIICAGQITSLSLCDNLQKIAVGLLNKIEVYDIETRALVRSYKGHSARVNSVNAHPHRDRVLISGGKDGTIAIWDLKSPLGKKIEMAHEVGVNKDGVKIVRIAGDENQFLSCADDKTTKVWDLNQLKPIHVINQFAQPAPQAMEYNTQCDRFMICATYVSRYNATNAALMATFYCTQEGIQETLRGSQIRQVKSCINSCASIDQQDEELLALGTHDGSIALRYPENKTLQSRTIDVFGGSPVDQIALSPQGLYLAASCVQKKSLQVYELPKKSATVTTRRGSFKGCLGIE